MTERRKRKFNWHEFRVGIFVIGSFAILLLMIFRVSGGRGLFAPKLTAVSYLPTIEGLKPGAPVWLNGIEIGNVEEIRLASDLPDTRANQDTLLAIDQLKVDIARYQEVVRETGGRLDDLRVRQAAATGPAAETLREAVLAEEERYARLQRNIRNLENDLKLSYNNLQNIMLVLKMEERYAGWIKRDSEVAIGSIGLLGDKYVEVSIGRSDVPALRTPEGHLLIEGINEATIRQLMVGANDLIANFGDISETVKSITTKLDTGQGTIGQLINNTLLHDSLAKTVRNLDQAVSEAGLLLADIRTSSGSLNKLIHEDTLYNEVRDTVSELKVFTRKLNQADGTVNRLVHDPALYDNLRSVTARVDAVMERLERGEGTLGRLTVDDALFVEARDVLKRVRGILEQVDAGQGTLGLLLKDRVLYDNLNAALSEMVKLLYDVRKEPKKYLKIKFSIF